MINHFIFIAKYLLFSSIILGSIPDQLISQNTITFENGLALPMSHQYTREAVHLDIIEWQQNHGKFETPYENSIADITEQGDTLRWQKVEVQDNGRFSGSELRSGYLYLSFYSDEEKVMWFNADGHNMAYINGVPRAGDIYAYGYMYLPVKVKEGKNEILLRSARWGGIQAKLVSPDFEIGLLDGDLTLPHILSGEEEPLWGAIRIINSTDDYFEDAEIKSSLNGIDIIIPVPPVAPMTVRKVPFQFNPSGAGRDFGNVELGIELIENGSTIHEKAIEVEVVAPKSHYSRTFISKIDGSVQYYSVAPQQNGEKKGALFLSVHGAEVEAINQVRAYQPKDWGNLIAPTNRRPRGFNWEDWGRMDALEVLEIAKEKFNPDPQRIYLTGHSMGGHGTWYLGATYPGKWAAIAPAAGYPSLRAYGSHDGTVPDHEDQTPIEQLLLRSSNPADVMSLIPNYEALGVYILHGDADRVVSVEHARTMRYELGKFHPDFTYYEYPGGSHWYGDESVDWPPLFQFFKERELPDQNDPDEIRFKTANPGISHTFRWASIEQQINPLEFSSFYLNRNNEDQKITGTTENTDRIALNLSRFNAGEQIEIKLDNGEPVYFTTGQSQSSVSLMQTESGWEIAEELSSDQKGPHRYGGFKEAFTNQMVFVYGTGGTEQENKLNYQKARYDAETWYYRGNGSVDLIRDADFELADFEDRSVILYGNRDNNTSWDLLLENSPIQIERNRVVAGEHVYEGENLGVYFTYPRPDSDVASVAVISGTGTTGIKTVTANQYFAGGSGYPDYMIFTSDMLINGSEEIMSIGFFNNDWSLNPDKL